MYGTRQGRAGHDAAGDRGRRAVQARARADLAAVGPHHHAPGSIGAQLLRQQLPGPGRPPRRRGGRGKGVAGLGIRHGQRAVHLRHAGAAQAARAGALGLPADGGHDPLLVLLRRQRRRLRGAVRRRGRDHLRRAQPRLDHRRHPAVQGQAVPLQERRHGRPAHPAARRPRTPAPGARSSSPTASSRWTGSSPRSTRSATSPTSSARWSWSTTATPSGSSATAAAARPSGSA